MLLKNVKSLLRSMEKTKKKLGVTSYFMQSLFKMLLSVGLVFNCTCMQPFIRLSATDNLQLQMLFPVSEESFFGPLDLGVLTPFFFQARTEGDI